MVDQGTHINLHWKPTYFDMKTLIRIKKKKKKIFIVPYGDMGSKTTFYSILLALEPLEILV